MWRRLISTGVLGLGFAIVALTLLGRISETLDAFSSLLPVAPVMGLIALILAPGIDRRKILFLVCVAATLLVPAFIMGREIIHRRPNAVVDGGRLVVVTHNVSVRNHHPAETAKALLATGADMLLLQETDGTLRPYLDQLKAQYPYSTPCLHRCPMIILSKLPLTKTEYRFHDGNVQFGPPLVAANAVLPNGQNFMIATLHMPWPIPAEPQASMRSDLVDAIAALPDKNLVLTGDFNLTPWSAAMARLDQGIAPLRRVTHGVFSFPARIGTGMAIAPPILPIDQAFVGSRWSVVSVQRLRRTGSDHYPIRIELRLNNTE